MSTIVVNTTSDSLTLNLNDGVTTLREALAWAAAGDTIVFAASLDQQTITLVQGLVIDQNVIIDGDRNNDGFADITLNGQANGYVLPHIAILGGETHVVIDGLNFTQGGSRTLQTGGFGTDGAYGTATAVDGVDRPLDPQDETSSDIFEEGGRGLPGRDGGAAPDAGDALPAGVTGGAIYNQGILTLNNVQLYDNSAIGGTGGNGATGNTANGVGGDGGRGGRGSNTSQRGGRLCRPRSVRRLSADRGRLLQRLRLRQWRQWRRRGHGRRRRRRRPRPRAPSSISVRSRSPTSRS